MSFLMSFALEPEIVTLAWIDNAFVQFPLNIYATKGFTCVHARLNFTLIAYYADDPNEAGGSMMAVSMRTHP